MPVPTVPTHGRMARLSWPGWLVKYQDSIPAMVTHLGANRARRRVILLTRTTLLKLNRAATAVGEIRDTKFMNV